MFRGINTATLDGKGRLALPVRLRETAHALADGKLVATIDVSDCCLLLYPLPEWEVVQSRLEALANIGNDARWVQRLLVGHATDLELDGQGRILLPSLLRDHAELAKRVTLVGQGNKLELWAEATWAERLSEWKGSKGVRELAESHALNGLKL